MFSGVKFEPPSNHSQIFPEVWRTNSEMHGERKSINEQKSWAVSERKGSAINCKEYSAEELLNSLDY